MKTEFYKYENDKIYSTCIECSNEKVKCQFCDKEFNKTYLSKHIERCLIKKLHLYNYNIENHNENNFANNTEGASRIINNNDENHNDENHNDNNMFTGRQQSCNRTLIVGPAFCGKTHL